MANKNNNQNNIIAFQGVPGAYSEMACLSNFKNMKTLPCPSFEEMISSVQENRAKLAMVPVENSTAGRVLFFRRSCRTCNFFKKNFRSSRKTRSMIKIKRVI